MSLSQLTIYGAGLIGGSIAHFARNHGLCERLVAIDTQAPHPSDPKELFDDWAVTPEEQKRALRDSELTMMCVPVRAIIDQLPLVLAQTDGVVSDCGSTKTAICRAVLAHPGRERFVAGHPMAGHPEGGLMNASQDLFHGRRWILCPEGSSAHALGLVQQLVLSLGAHVVRLKDTEHDASVAWTSHVPQVVASTLSVYAHQNDALKAAGPGFASATRVAGGAEAMWGDIFGTNSEAIGRSLSQVGRALSELGEQLQAGDAGGTMDILAQARAVRALQPK